MYSKLLLLILAICSVNAYKILVLYPMPAKSVSQLGDATVKYLLNAGHEVTYVTVFPIKNTSYERLRQIDISFNLKAFESYVGAMNLTSVLTNPDESFSVKDVQEMGVVIATMTLENQNFLKLLQDTTEHFDAVVVDLFEDELYSGLSALYSCPMIWSYSMGAHSHVLSLIDEAVNPAYTRHFWLNSIPPLTFLERSVGLLSQLYYMAIKRFSTKPLQVAAYKRFFEPLFKQRGKTLPDYDVVIYNASLILANDHLATDYNPSTPQNFKFVGGFHISTPTEPLPQDLQNLMDQSEYGVIYFSLGSVVKSKDMPKSLATGLLEMLGQLKQTVIWKYEDDSLVNVPTNVHLLKWAPQQSILAHPKCLFFISHGGLLSSTEAIHFGVPIIGIPVFADQFLNVVNAVTRGYALRVDLTFDLPKDLKSAIETMLKDNRYKQKVKELSLIYHDRPVPPGKELVHWVEHVIRTRGALHLRSPALHVPFYQKMYLDLFAVVVLSISMCKIFFKFFLCRIFGRGKKQKLH